MTLGIITKWNHYDNLYALFKKVKNCKNPLYKIRLDDIFNIDCLATLKIDGSNLAIKIVKNNDEYEIESLNSRNEILWIKGDDKYNKKFGHPGHLNNLPIYMKEIAIKIATKLNVDELIVYGEAFRANKNNISSKFASWHPFGYSISSTEEPKLIDTDLLSDICPIPETIIDFNSFIDFLLNANNHCIFPPPLLFSGKIGDLIMKNKDMLLDNPLGFEGFFIVYTINHIQNGYKLKTVQFLDQKTEFKKYQFEEKCSQEIYSILENIYIKACDGIKISDDNFDINSLINNAFNHELLKNESFQDIPPGKDRIPIVEKFIPLVIDEINRYLQNEQDLEIELNKAQIKIVKSKVHNLVMMYK